MSEIERYDCEEDRSCEYEVKAVMQVDPTGYYVRHADHLVYLNEMRLDRDAQRLRADTAEAELKIVRKSRDDELENYNALISELAAAEQRIAELLVMLRQAWVDECVSAADCRKIDAALNPNPEAESHE